MILTRCHSDVAFKLHENEGHQFGGLFCGLSNDAWRLTWGNDNDGIHHAMQSLYLSKEEHGTGCSRF